MLEHPAKTERDLGLSIGGVIINGDATMPTTILQMTVTAVSRGNGLFVVEWRGGIKVRGSDYPCRWLIGQPRLKGSVILPNLEIVTGDVFTGVRRGLLLFQIPMSKADFDKVAKEAVFSVTAIDDRWDVWETQRSYADLAGEYTHHFKS